MPMKRETKREYDVRYRELNRERLAVQRAAYKAAHRDDARVYRAANREKQRAWTLKSEYGLTPAEYADRLAFQEGRCAICREPMAKPKIDHDHETGLVRGILCHPCNVGLGWFRDDPGRLAAAITYLAPFGEAD